MKILVTGASGFVGQHICPMLLAAGHDVVAGLRGPDDVPAFADAITRVTLGELGPQTPWRAALDGVDAIIHLAARTHVMDETAANPELAYRRINVDATAKLARDAVAAGVKRIVFLSSIKVNGEASHERPFTSVDRPAPEDAYGRTKRDAEVELARATKGTAVDVVTLRAPLIYGPGVKGNFLKLMQAIAGARRLPLGLITANRRSFLYVGNLCAAVRAALESPAAAGNIYLLSDGEDLSTAELSRRLGRALGQPARLLPVPAVLLRLAGALSGRRAAVARLTGSLRVDARAIQNDLGWCPTISVDQGLERTADWFKSLKT